MRFILTIAAVSLTAAIPASALAQSTPIFAFRDSGAATMSTARHGPRDGDRRFRHRRGDGVLIYDRDYQGDTAWHSASFNDWWHENSARSYPRWMQNNAGCERQWYAGDTLRC